jgi:hypothetical protein
MRCVMKFSNATDCHRDRIPIMKSTTLFCLGGGNDVSNLWPQPRRNIELKWNAEAKDRLETVLCNLVCDGLLDIGDAQEAIITDWIAAYHLYNE